MKILKPQGISEVQVIKTAWYHSRRIPLLGESEIELINYQLSCNWNLD